MSFQIYPVHPEEKTNVIVVCRLLCEVVNLDEAAGAKTDVERGLAAIIDVVIIAVWVTQSISHEFNQVADVLDLVSLVNVVGKTDS
jgi:hypothetical protein